MKISLFHVNWFASAEQFCSVLRQLLPQYSVWALLLQNTYISNRLVAQGRISVIYVLFYHTCSCIRGQVQVRAALLMTTEIRYTMLCIYYECAATKLDQQHVESWLSEIEWIVETASWFIVGVSNPAPGELPSYRFQLQPKSNTPEPANQSSSRLVHVRQVCWEQGRNWNLQDGSSPGAGL